MKEEDIRSCGGCSFQEEGCEGFDTPGGNCTSKETVPQKTLHIYMPITQLVKASG